jgi:hypothetical protein
MELNQLSTFKMENMTENMQNITQDMHASTLNMEQLAEKTEKETSSMHFITLVTLVFLPPTFVAVRYGLPLIHRVSMPLTSGNQTFLGSGVFQWEGGDGEGQRTATTPVWKPYYFKLFAAIAFPLMGITILIWLGATILWPKVGRAMSWVKGYSRSEKLQGDEEACVD